MAVQWFGFKLRQGLGSWWPGRVVKVRLGDFRVTGCERGPEEKEGGPPLSLGPLGLGREEQVQL